MGIIDGEISTIRDEVYGEEIRTAIYTAFEKLSNGIPSSDEIYGIIEEAIGSGDVLKFKGELSDNNVFDLNTIKYHEKNPGIFTVEQRNSYYSHMPIDSDNGYYVLVDLSTDDTFVVQMLFPTDLTADGTFWVRMKLSTNSNESYGWYRIRSGGASALTVKGNLETVTNLNTMSAVEDQGIYRIVSSWSYSGLPSGFGGIDAILKNYIFTLSSSSSAVVYRIQELSYIDGSKSWIRGKSGTATFVTSDWKEVAGSGSGGTVDPQDIEDAVFDYLKHDADLNQIIANYIGDQGSVDETSVKGWIEGYVDKDNTSNKDGKDKFNASVNALIQAALSGYSTTDRTYSSDVNQAVTGFLTANSDLSDANKEYITNARSEYTTYNDTVKPSVADGVVGLAAFRMAIEAIKPARSGGEVENSIKSLYATTRDATKPIGWATDWANAYDLAMLIRSYNTYYEAGDARSELNPLTKAAVADGMLGFAAFKRTEWYPTPQMYGAYADGVHDDLGAIQRAINANRGKTLYFPAGVYVISDQIRIGWADANDPVYGNAAFPNDILNSNNKSYTDLIFDPSAVIKAGNDIPEGSEGHVAWAGSYESPRGMILIGEYNWHEIQYKKLQNGEAIPSGDIRRSFIRKARKKVFKGGVFDSNRKYVSWIIQVSQDVVDFDMSDSVLLATNATAGLSVGSPNWKKRSTDGGETWSYYNASDVEIARGTDSSGNKVSFEAASMDAYIHHITILKYYYNKDELPQIYKEASPINHNRASGILIYSSDNNFDNIRVYYFKRQIKFTRGSGNYFSDVHTLGLKQGETDNNGSVTLAYDSTHYGVETSGFHIEHKTKIVLDQCYVDSDSYFLYEEEESNHTDAATGIVYASGAGSVIEISQCTFYMYEGNNRTMRAFHLAAGEVSKLFVDGFYMAAKGDFDKEKHINRHTGIELSCTMPKTNNVETGGYFEQQVNSCNMSLERIRIDWPNRLIRGDLLKGPLSGEKGSVLFKPTNLDQKTYNGTKSKHSYWYKLCDIPVGGGAQGNIEYHVTLWTTGRYIKFPFAIRTDAGNPNKLIINRGSGAVETDDNKDYELCFTYNNPNSMNTMYNAFGQFRSYTIWIRLLGTSTTSYTGRTLKRAIFESQYAITPTTPNINANNPYTTLPVKKFTGYGANVDGNKYDKDLVLSSLDAMPTFNGNVACVALQDAGDSSKTGNVMLIKGTSSGKTTTITTRTGE